MAKKHRKGMPSKKKQQTKASSESVAIPVPDSGSDSELYSKDSQENNNVVQQEEFDDEVEENEWCEHMEDSDEPAIQRLMITSFPCNACQETAHFSCVHSDCINNSNSSCCENIKHIFPHIMMNDHPVIFHHKYKIILCTQCNLQTSLKYFMKFYGMTDDATPDEPIGPEPLQLQATSGYLNFGTTCYLNAIFQFLGHCPPFAEFFCAYEPPGGWEKFPSRTKSAACQLAIDIRLMWHEMRVPYINPWRLVNCMRHEMPGFETFQQQDASELLRALLEIIDRELKKTVLDHQLKTLDEDVTDFQKIPTIITQLFQGKIQNRIECHSCGFQSRTYENFSDLSLPIVAEDDELDSMNPDENPTVEQNVDEPNLDEEYSSDPGYIVHRAVKNKTSLNQCLDQFFQNTVLQGENQYSCTNCKAHVDATKSSTADELPEVILVQLKRFRHTMQGTRKIVKVVQFPVRSMDFGRYTTSGKPALYDLIGFVVHEGHSLDYGHYVTYSKHLQEGSWYKFDDLITTRTNEYRVAKKDPYILMFRKQSTGLSPEVSEIKRFPKIPYNTVRSSNGPMKQRGDAWELVQNFLESETSHSKPGVKIDEDRIEELKEMIREDPDHIPDGEVEEIYEAFESLLNDLTESRNNLPASKDENAWNNIVDTKNDLIRAMENWLKSCAKKAFVERELNLQGRSHVDNCAGGAFKRSN